MDERASIIASIINKNIVAFSSMAFAGNSFLQILYFEILMILVEYRFQYYFVTESSLHKSNRNRTVIELRCCFCAIFSVIVFTLFVVPICVHFSSFVFFCIGHTGDDVM